MNPALPGNKTLKVNPLNLEFLNQAKNVPVVLPSSPIKIQGKSANGFISYDRTDKQRLPL